MSNDIKATIDERPITATIQGAVVNITGGGGGGVTDGDKGDIVVSGAGETWTIQNMDENATVTTGTYVSKVNQDLLIKVRKATSGTITKGQAVYIVGSTGNHLTVELARADVEATSAYTIGIAATTITSSNDGFVIQNGRLTGLSTVPTATFSDGDTIYLSETTAGGYRVGIPTAPNHGVLLGFVIKTSNGNAGEIDIRVQNYQELEELSDVYINNKTTNDFLVRKATRWENITPADVKTILAINNVDNTSDLNKPISTATQTALDGKVNKSGDTMTGVLVLPRSNAITSNTEANATKIGNGTNSIQLWATAGGAEISTENGTRIRMNEPLRFDAVAGEFTINRMPIVIRCETDAEDNNAKGTFIEWDQLFRSGVTYDYGIAESAYRNWIRGGSVGPAPTFTVATTGQKRVMWFGQHYESAAGTGEETHMHGNWETCQADMSTIVTRIQVGYGEDWTEVSVVNADFAISKNGKFFLASDKNVYMTLNGTDGDVSWILTQLILNGRLDVRRDLGITNNTYNLQRLARVSADGFLEFNYIADGTNLTGYSIRATNSKDIVLATTSAPLALVVKPTTGFIGIGTSSPTDPLDVNGDAIRIRTKRTPASATATGVQGEITWDDNYVYWCTGTNNWKQIPILPWGASLSGTNTGDQNLFSTIAVAGQSNVVADSTSDTLTLVAGSNITLTTNATNDEITIASTGGGGGGFTYPQLLSAISLRI
jgi:hypothetical protein